MGKGKKYFFFNKPIEKTIGDDKPKKCSTIKKEVKLSKKEKKQQKKLAKEHMDNRGFGFASWKKPETTATTAIETFGNSTENKVEKYYASTTNKFSKNYEAERYLTKQPVVDPENVVATAEGAFEVVHSEHWGSALIPVIDPKALPITPEDIANFKLKDNFPKIPKTLWARWMKLVFHYCEQREKYQGPTPQVLQTPAGEPSIVKIWNLQETKYDYFRVYNEHHAVKIENPMQELGPAMYYSSTYYSPNYQNNATKELEVTALLLRKADDLTQWKIVIPRQSISRAAVQAQIDKTVDIETGEQYSAFPPDGWLHAGSTHSHNTMGVFFSKTDDESELSVPGVHIVVGQISRYQKTYEAKASVVLRQTRKFVAVEDVVEIASDPDANFHANVLEQISERAFQPTSTIPIVSDVRSSVDEDYSEFFGGSDPDVEKFGGDDVCLPKIADQEFAEHYRNRPHAPNQFEEDEDAWMWCGL